MNINGKNIDFYVAPQNFCLPYDVILGIKILTEKKFATRCFHANVTSARPELPRAHTIHPLTWLFSSPNL